MEAAPQPKKIDRNDPQQIVYWAKLLNMSEDRLRSLIEAFGNDVGTLAEVLSHSKPSTWRN
jgi:Protein of unknown function (DUF3606)